MAIADALLCPALIPGTPERRALLKQWIKEWGDKGYLLRDSPGLAYQLERYRREPEGHPTWWKQPKRERPTNAPPARRRLSPEAKAQAEREKLAKWMG